MIITRTPYRISFFGGGTDYPVWYRQNGGAVLSTTINRYNYITCRFLYPFFNYKYRVTYSKIEEVNHYKHLEHPSIRECLRFLKINNRLAVQNDSDLPARSGLGSSSTFTVGLLNALYGLKGEMRTKHQLALDAIHVEQNMIKENVGSQDQAAAAFGGLNRIEFGGTNEVVVSPITINDGRIKELENHLMIFFTGFSRIASEIAAEQIKKVPQNSGELRAMRQMVDEAIGILHGKENLDDFGKLLHESWQIKRGLSSKISNSAIDQIYNTGLKAGALGGKLLGAGGGGFMLFFAPPEKHKKIKDKLKKFLYVPFEMEHSGSQIIYYTPQNLI